MNNVVPITPMDQVSKACGQIAIQMSKTMIEWGYASCELPPLAALITKQLHETHGIIVDAATTRKTEIGLYRAIQAIDRAGALINDDWTDSQHRPVTRRQIFEALQISEGDYETAMCL